MSSHLINLSVKKWYINQQALRCFLLTLILKTTTSGIFLVTAVFSTRNTQQFSVTEILPFHMNLLEVQPGKGGTAKEERRLYTVPPLCPVTRCRGELQCKDCICHHMDQPLENNWVYLAEVPSTGVAVIWLLLLCNLHVQKSNFMENCALETDTGQARSLAGDQLIPLQQGQRLEQGERGETGPMARAHGKGSGLLAAIPLPAICPLAGRGWISSPARVVTSTCTEPRRRCVRWVFHSRGIRSFDSWCDFFCLITFGSIYKANLCIILGLFLPHRTAVTEVFTSAKHPWKLLHTLDKHALRIWLS